MAEGSPQAQENSLAGDAFRHFEAALYVLVHGASYGAS
jgi:hypothetical protein